MTKFHVNGHAVEFKADPDTPLLWVLRDHLGLTGTKFGCGMAQCGACTVHVDGEAVRSCVPPVGDVAGKRVITIEGIAAATPWRSRCRRPGSTRTSSSAATASPGRSCPPWPCSRRTRRPSDAQIDEAMGGNLCRCGTYPRIREAIKAAGASLAGKR